MTASGNDAPTQDDLPSLLDELSLWSSYFGRLLLENVPLRRGLSVLDVACGAGFPLLELAQRLGPSARVVGIDTWAPAVARARWKAAGLGLQRTFVARADGARMPFGPASFDLIVCNLGVNNFEHAESVFAECGRVARPGARLALTTNPEGHLQEFYAVFEATLLGMDLPERLPALRRHVAHRLSQAAIQGLLETAGFRLVRRRDAAFALRYLDGTTFFRHFLTRVGFVDGWRSVLEPGEEEAVFAGIEEALNREASARGSLEMTVPILYLEAERS